MYLKNRIPLKLAKVDVKVSAKIDAKKELPKTGDSSHIILFSSLLTLAGALLISVNKKKIS